MSHPEQLTSFHRSRVHNLDALLTGHLIWVMCNWFISKNPPLTKMVFNIFVIKLFRTNLLEELTENHLQSNKRVFV